MFLEYLVVKELRLELLLICQPCTSRQHSVRLCSIHLFISRVARLRCRKLNAVLVFRSIRCSECPLWRHKLLDLVHPSLLLSDAGLPPAGVCQVKSSVDWLVPCTAWRLFLVLLGIVPIVFLVFCFLKTRSRFIILAKYRGIREHKTYELCHYSTM